MNKLVLDAQVNQTVKNENKRDFRLIFKKFTYILLGLLAIVGIGYGVKILMFSQAIGLKITPGTIVDSIQQKPELKKDSTGKYTNVLLVGIDTRSATSDLKNTDTMIIASYNHESGNVAILSIPRDLYIEVPNEGWYMKVNGIYGRGEQLKKGNGMEYLKSTLQSITGLEIQYWGLIDLQGFIKVIDAIGGVEVDVENTFTDYQYPREKSGGPVYETISFKKGKQTMDGATALTFARSRHSINPLEGSDFARAKRQQKVIIAVKDKVLSSDTLLNPKKVVDILNALEANIKLSPFTTQEIQAGVEIGLAQRENKGGVYQFVLEPSVGNGSVVTASGFNVGGLYVIGPVEGLGKYTRVKQYIKNIIEDPKLYSENALIMIYDSGLGTDAKIIANNVISKYPFLNIRYMGKLYSDKTGTVVYSHSTTKYNYTVSVLGKSVQSTSIVKPEYVKNDLNGEDITILLGKKELPAQTQ